MKNKFTQEELMYLYHILKRGLSPSGTSVVMNMDKKKGLVFPHHLFDKIRTTGEELEKINGYIEKQEAFIATFKGKTR